MSVSATSTLSSRHQSWLDHTAILLAVLCGIHCLATPILLVALPLLANTLWVSENFHLGMLLMVFPTSLLAAFAGCRQHRDKWVTGFIVAGLTVLSVVTTNEVMHQFSAAEHGASDIAAVHEEADHHDAGGCPGCCPVDLGTDTNAASAGLGSIWTKEALLNSLGGLFLVMGHARNFLLCRRHRCDHTCEG